MNKLIKAAIIGGATMLGAAAAVAGAAYSLTKLFVREALEREEPKLMLNAKSVMLESPKREPLLEESAAAAERLRTADTERVEINAWGDRVPLVGHLRRCENPERIILAMHGWRSSWYKDFGAVSDFWRNNNCTVLYAEQRGQGESGGEVMSFGLLERRDCLAWLDWLNKNVSAELPIYLAGVSMGATTVLLAAELPQLPPNVRGVMADCGFTSPEAIWRHVSENQWHIPYNPFRYLTNRLCREKLHFSPDAASTVKAMEHTSLPVLFVHGLDDDFVPPSMTEENYEACASPEKRLLLVPGAKHGMSYLVNKDAYEAQVLDFWKTLETERVPSVQMV